MQTQQVTTPVDTRLLQPKTSDQDHLHEAVRITVFRLIEEQRHLVFQEELQLAKAS